MAVLTSILQLWQYLALWLLGFFIVFSLLARVAPCNPAQPLFRRDMLTDILYAFVLPVLNRCFYVLLIAAGLFLFLREATEIELGEYLTHGFGPLSTLPLWLQAAMVFLLSDVLMYWFHRAFHGRKLWRFHAIHHSAKHVDWLSAYRFHPINTWLSFVLTDAIMMSFGFSPAAVGVMANVNLIYSAMVHANVNWTFGPFKCLFASPVFHRWHHTAQEEGMDKNFAPTFPLLDIAFGTFYMPEGRLPENFGVAGSDIPSGFMSQMVWPFRRKP